MQGAVDQYDSVAHRAEDGTRRIVAAIQGALEGFVEALDKYEVANEGQRAMEQAGEIARAAATEGRAQGQSPEMQQLGGYLHTAGTKTADVTRHASGRVRDSAAHAKEGVVGGVTHARESVVDAAHHVRDNVQEKVAAARETVDHVRAEVKVRADAVAETGRRAKLAPRHIGHELGEAVASWKRSLVTAIAMGGVIALFGITAFIVLTMALISGLTLIVGWVGALFLVTLLYVIAAGIAYAVAKSAKTKAAHEREERMENAREEVRHVVRPVRDAFSRGRGI